MVEHEVGHSVFVVLENHSIAHTEIGQAAMGIWIRAGSVQIKFKVGLLNVAGIDEVRASDIAVLWRTVCCFVETRDKHSDVLHVWIAVLLVQLHLVGECLGCFVDVEVFELASAQAVIEKAEIDALRHF